MHHDLSRLEDILARYPRDESSLVMVLQDIQAEYNYLPCEALEQVALELEVPRTHVFAVGTFYKVFSLEPQGQTVVQVCKGTACHVRGAPLIEDELCRLLGVPVGGTTEDLEFTIKTVNCVGACAMAPVVITGKTFHSRIKPARVKGLLKRAGATAQTDVPADEELEAAWDLRIESPADLLDQGALMAATRRMLPARVLVCGGPGCLVAGSREVHRALARAATEAGLSMTLELGQCEEPERDHLLSLTGCQGPCQLGPLVRVLPQDVLLTHASPADAAGVVEALARGLPLEETLDPRRLQSEHPFPRGDDLKALSSCGRVHPESLSDYLSVGGFESLARALAEKTPEQVLDAVAASGLRGRGGAGFSTGRKWRSAVAAGLKAGHRPYVLCNGDEGDPGAFMDRLIMEGSPFQVLEGMIIGAYALGGRVGYLYVRHEYPLAVKRLGKAIEDCRAAGLLGQQILGSELCFDLHISRGGGAFVCGESTALMRSIEGKVGEPRAKYVRSVERGLHDSPTVLNNVETWALVPGIVLDGPEAFRSVGTDGSPGTKAFSLCGQVQHTGLVEVPMGTTLRELIFDIGGGMPAGSAFKAVQTGGPSGGCLPEDKLDLPIDFDALTEAGSMMGSGGMIIMDDHTCMVDIARYFVEFLEGESCGKCPPCRLGLGQLSQLLRKVSRGEAEPADLAAIEDVARGTADSALCGLGTSAPNPVLSTLRYFRHEYEAHLQGRCPAGVCKELIRYEITSDCTGCLLCIKPCPVDAISGSKKEVHELDQELCTRCGICRSLCQYDAIRITSGGNP